VINAGAVQRKKRHAATVLDIVNQDVVDPLLHGDIVLRSVTATPT